MSAKSPQDVPLAVVIKAVWVLLSVCDYGTGSLVITDPLGLSSQGEDGALENTESETDVQTGRDRQEARDHSGWIHRGGVIMVHICRDYGLKHKML